MSQEFLARILEQKACEVEQMELEEIQPLTELAILRITFIYGTIKGMSQKYRVNIKIK